MKIANKFFFNKRIQTRFFRRFLNLISLLVDTVDFQFVEDEWILPIELACVRLK